MQRINKSSKFKSLNNRSYLLIVFTEHNEIKFKGKSQLAAQHYSPSVYSKCV